MHPSISLTHFIAYNGEQFELLGTQGSVQGLTHWFCVEMSPRCAFPTAFITGSVLENCLTCYQPPNFLTSDNFLSVLHKLKYHPQNLDTWHSTTVRFRRNFLPRATQLCNGIRTLRRKRPIYTFLSSVLFVNVLITY